MNNLIKDIILKNLLQFNNQEEIAFNKSQQTMDRIANKTMYGFIDCQPGDPIYKNEINGYNLLDGELIGYCVIPAGVLKDGNPRFAYRDVLTNKDGQYKRLKWASAKAACNHFRNNLDDFNFYCPTYNELYTAYDYAYGNGLNIFLQGLYWTSDYYRDEYGLGAFVLFMNKGKAMKDQTIHRDQEAYVIPFFKIPNIINIS